MKNTQANHPAQANSHLPKPMMVLLVSALMTSPAFLAGCTSNPPQAEKATISYQVEEQELEENLPMVSESMEAITTPEEEENIAIEDTADSDNLAAIETPTDANLLEEVDEALESIPAITYQQPQQTTFHYEFNKQELSDTDMIIIREHAFYLSEHPSKKVQIHGHADAQGASEYNQHLSRERANQVAKIFKEEGIAKERIEIISWGSDKPMAEGKHWKDHRRVELKYSDEVLVEASELQEESINTVN